jgi:hypothetical protein
MGDLRMKNKAVIAIILSIAAVIGCMVLNFQEFLRGSPANAKNLIVTFVYLAIWILVLIIGTKNNNRRSLMYCFVFWIVTLLFSMLTVYVNATGAPADWAIPFVILLLGQWYGIRFIVNDFLTVSIIITLISLGISTAAILLLKRIKRA